ncbi:WXG100 family type VII secretion target [Actinomadura parmotrematis]|uniref:WXG100 family type VII secretion target n=1 Tax=Actinomadura parmotrematis TaxID=2864039 RepID=A0ABS7FXX0_9ACTN|nr:hypothetical protein [Actinomadura parmotrematis]MBW8485267.1 hypothetical protein [Actinomadura parmotrematis]
MGTPLDPCKGLAEASMYESLWASCIIPAAIPINPIVYAAQGDPAGIWEGADGWKETADQIRHAQAAVTQLIGRIPETDWAGEDRTAFTDRMHDYHAQLTAAADYAQVIETALRLLAMLIGVFIYLMFGVVTLLTIFATAIAIAAGSIVGAPAALEIEAEANTFATQAFTILNISSKVLTGTSIAVAALFSVLLGVDMDRQRAHGNDEVGSTFRQALVHSLDDQLKGLVNFLEQKYTGEFMGKAGAGGTARTAGFSNLEGILSAIGGADTRHGGPIGSDLLEKGLAAGGIQADDYGTDDKGSDKPARTYVDGTQPHR